MGRLIATPRSLSSSTHERLKESQYRKFEPDRRSLLVKTEDPVESKQLYELEMEQKKRVQKRSLEQGQGELTAAFLEADDDHPPTGQDGGVGPSILDVKRRAKPP